MIRAMNDKEVCVYSIPGKPFFLKIKGFSRKKIAIDMGFVSFYFLDHRSDCDDSFLGELPIKWKHNEHDIRGLLVEYSRPQKKFHFPFFMKPRETKVFLSGKFEIHNEEIIFVASKMKLKVSKESIPSDIARKIMLRSENDPVPKRHSCD